MPGDVNPGKFNEKYLKTRFDKFIAFGSGTNQLFTINLLLNSDLITDISKEKLKDFLIENDISDAYCNVHLGIKDNADIILVGTLTKPYKEFSFESNLDYSFKEIVKDFETLSNSKLTQEFLLDSKFDNLLKEQTKGILIKFTNVNGVYVVYFKSTIDGTTYTINK